MSGFAFDSNIVIDALRGIDEANSELLRAVRASGRVWISRVAWVEVMSKSEQRQLERLKRFLSGFGVDELDEEVGDRAAALRRERPRLKSPDAIVLASAQIRGRILVTRNIKDFPANLPGIRVPYTL